LNVIIIYQTVWEIKVLLSQSFNAFFYVLNKKISEKENFQVLFRYFA